MSDGTEKIVEEEEVIILETPPGEVDGERKSEEPDEDDRLRVSDDDDEDDNGKEGETPEQRSERRREERRQRKERQRRAEAAQKAELQSLRESREFMAAKLQQLEAAALRNEAIRVDQQMLEARARYEYSERAHEEAIARGDGVGATKALRSRDEAGARYAELNQIGMRLSSIGNGQQQQQPRRPQGPDPRVAEKAIAFVAEHPWIDPSGKKDKDSRIAQAVDIDLQSRGLDPTTDEYWTELKKELKEALPHRFKNENARKGPPVSGGSDRSTSGKKEFYLSPERIKAMKESGDWENPAKRAAMAKEYAAYDAANANRSTR